MIPVKAVRWAVLAGLCALAAGSSALAVQAWTPFFMIKQGVIYVDRNSVEHDGGKVSVTTELWYETPPDMRGQKLNYVRSRLTANCADRTFVITDQRFYGMDGQMIGENATPSAPLPAVKGTFESAVMTAYCPQGR